MIQNLITSNKSLDKLTKKELLNELEATKKGITRESWDAVQKFLGLMYIYCPDEIQEQVLSTIDEMTRRELYMGFIYE
jgi:hypothetical protein